MTEKVSEKTKPEKISFWSTEEMNNLRLKYNCEILIENGSLDDVKTKNAPTDSYIIQYCYQDSVCYDLTRGTKVNLFDMYWDKFKGGVKSINYGNGSIKPNLWGYKSPTPPKKKRKG